MRALIDIRYPSFFFLSCCAQTPKSVRPALSRHEKPEEKKKTQRKITRSIRLQYSNKTIFFFFFLIKASHRRPSPHFLFANVGIQMLLALPKNYLRQTEKIIRYRAIDESRTAVEIPQ